MLVRFWGTRGSLPVALKSEAVAEKVARALVAADGRRFAGLAEARAFATAELGFPTRATYGGATSCVEIEGGDGSFTVCDMGSGLREFGLSAMARASRDGRPKQFNIFLSHMHWDHIMGFPFFVPAFDPEAKIVIHGGHAEIETAIRRQQEQISFPVAFDWLRADISFRMLVPGESYPIGGHEVALIKQYHSYDSYGFRFRDAAGTVVYSTDSEHKADDMDQEAAFEDFFRGADLVIFDTMYSLGDAASMKEDWGHSSNLVAVDICQGAGVRQLALFHHEPTYNDDDIARMHEETIRYEQINRQGRPALDVLCAYDGLEVAI